MQELANNNMKKYLFIVLFFLGTFQLSAQISNIHLSFGSSEVLHATDVEYGDIITYSFWLVNNGNIPHNSVIDILIATDTAYAIRSLGGYANQDSLLLPGDSIHIITWDPIIPNHYKLGDNIVVIWPNIVSPYPFTADEHVTELNVSTLSSDNNLEAELNIYPNPVADKAMVESSQAITSVRIINVVGAVVREYVNLQENFLAINKNELDSGVYFVELNIAGNKVIKKIIIK